MPDCMRIRIAAKLTCYNTIPLSISNNIYLKILNLRKELGIAIKSKETNCQLEPVRNSYAAIMHQPVTISSNTCSQMHAQIKHSLVHLATRFIPYFGRYKM